MLLPNAIIAPFTSAIQVSGGKHDSTTIKLQSYGKSIADHSAKMRGEDLVVEIRTKTDYMSATDKIEKRES